MNQNAQGNPSVLVISLDLKGLSDNLTSTNKQFASMEFNIQYVIQKQEEFKFLERLLIRVFVQC
jgi:hypothetical protein